MPQPDIDPKNLIFESYQMDGISPEECRSIFLDWALSVPVDADHVMYINGLLQTYGDQDQHPMTAVLRSGLETYGQKPKRRGGYRSRPRP